MRTLLLIVALVLLGGWWWLRRRRDRQSAEAAVMPSGRHEGAPTAFHAVAIKTQPYACNAAHRLEGKRYISSEAPRLPLADCDRERCECRFQHYSDRRSGGDRRSPFGSSGTASASGIFEQDRRHKNGRRANDE